MINETYFTVMFHKTRIPEFPTALLFSLFPLCLRRFLCRVKQISVRDNDGKLDWFSVPVPPSSGTRLQVTGLSPATDYQFSVLSHNKVGTGPFSEIITTRTLGQYHAGCHHCFPLLPHFSLRLGHQCRHIFKVEYLWVSLFSLL